MSGLDFSVPIHRASPVFLQFLTLELRLNYSNDLSNTSDYYRRTTIELRLDYLASIAYNIIDVQTDEE